MCVQPGFLVDSPRATAARTPAKVFHGVRHVHRAPVDAGLLEHERRGRRPLAEDGLRAELVELARGAGTRRLTHVLDRLVRRRVGRIPAEEVELAHRFRIPSSRVALTPPRGRA